jgi:Fic family protein
MEANKLTEVFSEFKKLDYTLSLEEEVDIVTKYVHSTNKLEGNKLTLAQTRTILGKGFLSGEDVNLRDVLEQKGTYKALVRMINAVVNNEPLSINLIKELNWLCVGLLFHDDYYISYKKEGQKYGDFKVKSNRIEITTSNGQVSYITPDSSEKTVATNMNMLIKRIEQSDKDVIEKAAFLAQEIWLHQPFIDGNKRTARLLINFLTMKAGYPLFAYDNKGEMFNHLLIEQAVYGKPDLLKNFIASALIERMEAFININAQPSLKINKRKL